MGDPHAQPAEAPGRGGGPDRVRGRAEDRRPGDLAGVRERRADAGRYPWRRRDRRGGDPEPAHDQVHPAARGRCAAAARGARRGVPAALGLREAERTEGRRRRAHVRQPAQLRRRLDPPARPAARRRTPALDVVIRRGGGRGAVAGHPVRVARVAARARLQGEPRRGRLQRHRAAGRGLSRLGGAPRLAGLRDRRRGGEGQRPRAAAQPGRGGARAARGDRLEVPADDGHDDPQERGMERGADRPHDPVRQPRAGAGLRA